jgi:hypothetical protein
MRKRMLVGFTAVIVMVSIIVLSAAMAYAAGNDTSRSALIKNTPNCIGVPKVGKDCPGQSFP